MNENKLSLARKRSADPAQEHLREQKDIWNQAAKSLITKLIAFKRGLNGRGDPREGLPASKIEYPVPAQISQYLDTMSNEYTSLLDGAYSIIEEQNNYSEIRKQHFPAAAADDGMISEASWAGSRFWASFFGIKGKGKEHIIQMLNSTNEINKSLEDLENVLTSSNANSISTAVNEVGALGLSSIKSLLKSFEKLDDLRKKEQINNIENKPVTEYEQMVMPVNLSTDQKIETKEVEQEQIFDQSNEEDAQKAFFEYYNKFKLIQQDIKFSSKIIQLALNKAEDLNKIDNNKYDNTIKTLNDGLQFHHIYYEKIAKIVNAAKKTIEDISLVETANKMIKNFRDLYFKVVLDCSSILNIPLTNDQLNIFSGFRTLSNAIKKNDVSKKEASVKSYLKTRWMKFVNNIVSDKIEGVKLQCLDAIVKTLDKTNILMNSLEAPGTSTDQIKANILSFLRDFIYVNVLIKTLAELHNTEKEQEIINKKKKNVTLYEIKMSSIKKVENSIQYMRDFIADASK